MARQRTRRFGGGGNMPPGVVLAVLAVLAVAAAPRVAAAGRGSESVGSDGGGATLRLAKQVVAAAVSASGEVSGVKRSAWRANAALATQPVQLARPTGSGGIEVLEAGMRYLEALPVPLHVVSVVGSSRGGKSFLLNQLMGATGGSGFSVSSGVDSGTRGIWTFGVPATVAGDEAQVLFLDMEGLASTDSSLKYESSLLSLASIASTHLIYNSIRTIPPGEVEHLEMLARHARMFQLKASITESASSTPGLSGKDDFSFPRLVWSVRDFISELGSHRTSNKWLQAVLDRVHIPQASRGGLNVALGEIFPNASCVTFPPPAGSVKELRALPHAPPLSLDDGFRASVEELRQIIANDIRYGPIGRTFTGPELAQLIRFVLKGNDLAMDQLPAQWALYVDKQLSEAATSSVQWFERALDKIVSSPPALPSQSDAAVTDAKVSTIGVFRRLTAGLSGEKWDVASHSLAVQIEELVDAYNLEYAQHVAKHCSLEVSQILQEFRAFASQLTIPTSSKDLAATLAVHSKHLDGKFVEAVGVYGSFCTFSRQNFTDGVVATSEQRAIDNAALLEAALSSAKSAALSEYLSTGQELLASEGNDRPLNTQQLLSVLQRAREHAQKTFSAQAQVASGERLYADVKNTMEVELDEDTLREENKRAVALSCQAVVDRAVADVATAFEMISCPASYDRISALKADRRQAAMSLYSTKLHEYSDMAVYGQYRSELHDSIVELEVGLDRRQSEALSSIFARDLKDATELLREESRTAWHSSLLLRKARSVARRSLARTALGKDLHREQRDHLINLWLSRPEVETLIYSVNDWVGYAAAAVVFMFVTTVAKMRA